MAFFTIALSPCALFELNGGDPVYTTGFAFPFVKALEVVNQRLKELDNSIIEPFKIVLITNNQDLSHLNESIKQNNLNIPTDQICKITAGNSLRDHLNDLRPVLYLSTVPENVQEAIRAGHGAATMFQRNGSPEISYDKLRVAFDGDGVLFSDESETVFKNRGLQAFLDHETQSEGTTLTMGPLGKFAKALFLIQQTYSNCPIRTYLVTSRGTDSSGIRALRTLQEHKLGIDEALFLCGSPKGPMLKTINPHIFFDDQQQHVQSALKEGVVGAHVPFGVAND